MEWGKKLKEARGRTTHVRKWTSKKGSMRKEIGGYEQGNGGYMKSVSEVRGDSVG